MGNFKFRSMSESLTQNLHLTRLKQLPGKKMCTNVIGEAVSRDLLQITFWFELLHLIVQKDKTAICLAGRR